MIFLLMVWMSAATFGESGERTATVQWRAVPGARLYEIQLSKTATMEQVLHRLRVGGLSTEVSLRPGTYFFRVRGVDDTQSPGPWSEVQGFTVLQAPPQPVFPPDRASFSQQLPQSGLPLRWKALAPEVVIEVHDMQGRILERTVQGSELRWLPPKEGTYRWRVGTPTLTGVDWGPQFSFLLRETAIRPAQYVLPVIVQGYPEIYENTRDAEWLLIARATQSLLFWNLDMTNPYSNPSKQGSNLVAMFGVELAHRFARSRSSPWLFTAAAGGEFSSYATEGGTALVPNAHVELHATQGSAMFRWGPLVKGGIIFDQIALPDAAGAFAFRDATTRYYAGLGAIGAYALSDKFFLTLRALAKLHFGGRLSLAGQSLMPALGYEVSLGGQWFVTPAFLLEFRFRSLNQNLFWAANLGQTPNPNFYLQNYFVIDGGLGLRF